ncbi:MULTISPECIES: hypothetical protein [unclassified Paenibacillus]
MREATGISEQGEQTIQDLIHALTTHEDIESQNTKRVRKRLETFYLLV